MLLHCSGAVVEVGGQGLGDEGSAAHQQVALGPGRCHCGAGTKGGPRTLSELEADVAARGAPMATVSVVASRAAYGIGHVIQRGLGRDLNALSWHCCLRRTR